MRRGLPLSAEDPYFGAGRAVEPEEPDVVHVRRDLAAHVIGEIPGERDRAAWRNEAFEQGAHELSRRVVDSHRGARSHVGATHDGDDLPRLRGVSVHGETGAPGSGRARWRQRAG